MHANQNRDPVVPFDAEADRKLALNCFLFLRGALVTGAMALALFAFFHFDGGLALAGFIEGMNATIIDMKR